MKSASGLMVLLLIFILYSLLFFVGSTLAPILAHFQLYELSAKLTSTYVYSCHQQPDRSFWFMGYPIALCCRCYGFYLGVIISAILEVFNSLNINKKTLIILISISILDIFINYGLGIRLNTGNITRFIIGIFMGLIFTVFLSYLFKIKLKKEKS